MPIEQIKKEEPDPILVRRADGAWGFLGYAVSEAEPQSPPVFLFLDVGAGRYLAYVIVS